MTIIDDQEFHRDNQAKIDAAVAGVKRNYEAMSTVVGQRQHMVGYAAVKHDLATLRDLKTLIDVIDQMHADRHHFEKYHAADGDAWSGGEFYLGTECLVCKYSRSQQRAIDEHEKKRNQEAAG